MKNQGMNCYCIFQTKTLRWITLRMMLHWSPSQWSHFPRLVQRVIATSASVCLISAAAYVCAVPFTVTNAASASARAQSCQANSCRAPRAQYHCWYSSCSLAAETTAPPPPQPQQRVQSKLLLRFWEGILVFTHGMWSRYTTCKSLWCLSGYRIRWNIIPLFNIDNEQVWPR